MIRIFGLIIKAVVVGYFIIFAVANTETVTLNLLFDNYTLSLPLFLFTLFIIFLGAVFGILSTFSSSFKYKREIKRLRKELSSSNIDYAKIKNIALTNDEESNVSKIKTTDIENASIKNQLR